MKSPNRHKIWISTVNGPSELTRVKQNSANDQRGSLKLPKTQADTTAGMPVNAPPVPPLFCSSGALRLLPAHIQIQSVRHRKTHAKFKNNNLRVVVKAPSARLTWLKIHKATGKNIVSPNAGRRIFTGGVDAAQRERKHSGKKMRSDTASWSVSFT